MSAMDRPDHRPRSKSRAFSFKSDKSHHSGKLPKEQLRESSEEKHRNHLSEVTKANPNAAMNEAQPIAAALEAPTLASLRSIQHTDRFGNPIAEPDLSNPTRPRWERPLDTIRSFEAAIDTEYKRRSIVRIDSTPSDVQTGYNSRRSSYYGGGGYDQYTNPRYSGYYGSRTQTARDSYLGDSYGAPPVAGPSRNRFSQRQHPDAQVNRYSNAYGNQTNVYPTQAYQQSRDTVNTGGSSGSEPWAGSTDPSSENSSIERTPPVAKQPELSEQYGFSGFGGAPILEEYNNMQGGQAQSSANGHFQQSNGGPPAVPPKFNNSERQPGQPQRLTKGPVQPLSATSGNAAAARPALAHQNSEKRKSWFKRRFSKA